MSRFGSILVPSMALAVTIGLSGCGVVAPEIAAPSPSPTYAPTGDGILRIGTILPSTATAQVAAVEAAVREINEQGGVGGQPVEVFHRASGDATTETAEASLADLVAKGVDVVIGPASPDLAERLAEPAAAAGIPLISPSATGLAAVEDSGLLFSTAVGGAAQATALAAEITAGGSATVAYLANDDEIGTSGLDSLTTALEKNDATVAFDTRFDAAVTDFGSVASKTKKAKPDAVVVSVATVEQAAALLTALAAAGFSGDTIWLTARSAFDYSAVLAPGVLDGATGVIAGGEPDEEFTARVRQADPAVLSFSYAAEAYDATVLAALAVSLNGDDGGPAISRYLRSVSTGGIPCVSFGECLSVLATEPDIDYVGRSGPADLSESGDASRGEFTVVSYDETNAFTRDRVVEAG